MSYINGREVSSATSLFYGLGLVVSVDWRRALLLLINYFCLLSYLIVQIT